MKTTEYNGWTNYETWLANIWLTYDECTVQYMNDYIDQFIVSAVEQDQDDSDIVEVVSDFMTATLENLIEFEKVSTASLTADLLNAALAEINTRELAHAIIDWGTVEDKRAIYAEDMAFDNRPALITD